MAQLSLLQSLLGEKNPVAGWAGDNSNLLLGIGGSLLSRGMDFSNLPAYAALDTQAAQQKADAANTAQQKNATQEWLAKNYPQYSNLPIDQGWQLAMQLEGQKNSPRAMPDPIKLGAGETLFDPAEGRLGVVVTFLGLLTLAKEQLLDIVQEGPTAPIYVKSLASDEGAPAVTDLSSEFDDEPAANDE